VEHPELVIAHHPEVTAWFWSAHRLHVFSDAAETVAPGRSTGRPRHRGNWPSAGRCTTGLVQAVHHDSQEQILFGRRFVRSVAELRDGQLRFDASRFLELEPDAS